MAPEAEARAREIVESWDWRESLYALSERIAQALADAEAAGVARERERCAAILCLDCRGTHGVVDPVPVYVAGYWMHRPLPGKSFSASECHAYALRAAPAAPQGE